MLKKLIVIGLVAGAGYYYWHKHDAPELDLAKLAEVTSAANAEDAFRNHLSGVMVTAEGSVERILSDDTQDSRHQRFTVRLPSGQTLLVAHNIDLAPRVPVVAGAQLKLHGEYEWNDKGGVVHRTHKDPQHQQEAGWIEFGGRKYD
jgi:acylphosphatase